MTQLLKSKEDFIQYVNDLQQYTGDLVRLSDVEDYPKKYPCVAVLNIERHIDFIYLDDFEIKCEECKYWRMISTFKLGDFGIAPAGYCSQLRETSPFNFGCVHFNI